jgi:hypothetical protein
MHICNDDPFTGKECSFCQDERQRKDRALQEIIACLYADRETGELTGENTLAEKSACDFLEAVSEIISNCGLTPETVQ